jgi:O-antigen/teichoic acid export membrane protein
MTNTWNKIKNISSGLRGLGIIGITDITGATISALFWLHMAAVLGAEQYGQITYFISIGSIVATFSLLGSTNMLSVYVPKKIQLESTVNVISIIVGVITCVILFFIFSNASLSIYVIGMIFVGLAGTEILAARQYNSYPKYVITSKILMVGLSFGLYYLIGLDGIILGLGLALFPYLIRIYNTFKKITIDFSLLRPRWGSYKESFILNISLAFKGSIDKVIIGQMVGFSILGNYQLGFQFLSIMHMLPIIVFSYILPQDASGTPNKKLKQLVVLTAVGIAITGIVLAPIIIPHIFPNYIDVVEVVQIFSISVIPFTISMIFTSEFLGNEKIRIVLGSNAIFIIVMVSSIIILGNMFGINGIAFSMILANSAEAIFYFIMKRLQMREKLI